ncbi:hypothetical protein CRE_15016 [Caenorhabditis remanei]|uniref:Uncharacterized protein n=1 Tax=Caenorhabditis remanei TaxID=31234 RepID=E3NIQ5_CAERE|nr:hypothetical protein CRE_15016 [Caenorhabditis remanei]
MSVPSVMSDRQIQLNGANSLVIDKYLLDLASYGKNEQFVLHFGSELVEKIRRRQSRAQVVLKKNKSAAAEFENRLSTMISQLLWMQLKNWMIFNRITFRNTGHNQTEANECRRSNSVQNGETPGNQNVHWQRYDSFESHVPRFGLRLMFMEAMIGFSSAEWGDECKQC